MKHVRTLLISALAWLALQRLLDILQHAGRAAQIGAYLAVVGAAAFVLCVRDD